MRGLSAVVAVWILAACTRDAQLYPMNDSAKALGTPTVTFVAQGIGTGPVHVVMPDGEVLEGRYSMSAGAAVGFGAAYGVGAQSFAVGSSGSGFVGARGPKGTTVVCRVEGLGHGGGECVTSSGARYQVIY